jgi:WD40 repeat protein
LTGSWDKSLKVWDLNTKQLITDYRNFSSQISSAALKDQEDENSTFMVTSIDGNVLLFDPRIRDPIFKLSAALSGAPLWTTSVFYSYSGLLECRQTQSLLRTSQ